MAPAPQTPLPAPDANATYLWSDVQKVRPQAKSIKLGYNDIITIKKPLLFPDADSNNQLASFKVERSDQWFYILDCEVNTQGEIAYKLTPVGKATKPDRCVRVASVFYNAMTFGNTKEDFYQILSPTTQGTTAPATQGTGTVPATQGTAAPTSLGTAAPATQGTGAPTAQSTVAPATQGTTTPATKGTGV